MSVRVTDLRIKDRFGTMTGVNWLLAQRAEKLTIEVDLDIEEIFITEANVEVDRILLNVSPFRVDTSNVSDLVFCEQLDAFQNLNDGDTIQFHFTLPPPISTDTFVIYDKIDDQTFRVHKVGGSPGDVNWGSAGIGVDFTFSQNGYVALVTPFAGITYFYNFIENEGATNYESAVTGDLLRYTIDNADASDTVTVKPMIFAGDPGGQEGSATIKGRGIVNGVQRFTISHDVSVRPFTLPSEFQTLVNREKISEFDGGNCLRYITNIEAGRTLLDPNRTQDVQFDELDGNTGTYGENYNTGQTKYSVGSTTITRVSDSAPLTALELSEECELSVVINNTEDSPFSNNNTEYEIGFCYLPSDESFFVNNGKTMTENFIIDRAFQTVGNAPVNGDNFTTELQAIKTTEATLVSSSQIVVDTVFDIAAVSQALIAGRDLKRYKIYITTQNHTRTRLNSDKSTLLIDVNEFFVQLTQGDIVQNTNVFIQHPYTDKADGVSDPEVFPVDDIVARNDFSIDYTDFDTFLTTITSQIVLKKAGELDIILDNVSFDVSNATLVGGIQNINIEQPREFKRPDDIRRIFEIKRNASLDAGNVKNWYINYPFVQGYEYYIALALNVIPSDLFDDTEPNDGINNFWHRFTTISGWEIVHRQTFNYTQNGEALVQSFDYGISSNDYNSNDNWINESIKSFNVDSGLELIDGSMKFLEGYADTKIVASYENATVTLPTIDDIEFEFWIEVFEQGGSDKNRTASTVYDLDSLTWFKSIDGSNKILKEKTGSVYTATILVDSDLIPSNIKFRIYSRLHDKRDAIEACPSNALKEDITEDCLLTDVTEEPLLTD